MAKSKKSISEVIQKDYPEFGDVVLGMSVAELEQRLVVMAKELEKVEESLETSEPIKETKELLSDLTGPYRDAKKAIKLKNKYLIHLIKEKGGSV